MSHLAVQRHVRQYASSVGLNTNDDEHVNATSYSTRVERVQRVPGTKRRWTLTLRKMARLDDGALQVDWWTEEFDAVVVATHSESDAPWVPPIPRLKEWAEAFPDQIVHSREYRRPEIFKGKVCLSTDLVDYSRILSVSFQPIMLQHVLIVGGSVSGCGIANDLIQHAASVTASLRVRIAVYKSLCIFFSFEFNW